jgi:ATP-dependent Clp protease ATP-binding subunit ClpC
MGARPLRRIIQQKVEDQLSDALLSGTFHDGDYISVDLNAAGDIILLRDEAPAQEEAAAEPSA